MENLEIAGYRTVGENEKFTEHRILQTLVALASMHATSIIFEEIKGKSISEDYGDYLVEKNFLKKKNGWWTAGINVSVFFYLLDLGGLCRFVVGFVIIYCEFVCLVLPYHYNKYFILRYLKL